MDQRIFSRGFVEPTNEVERTGTHHPTRLYRFSHREPVTFERANGGSQQRAATSHPPQPMKPIVPGGSGTTRFSR